jgi:lysophospholipase L1-like esterase
VFHSFPPTAHGEAQSIKRRLHAAQSLGRAAVAAPGQPDRLMSSPDDLHPFPAGYKRMALALEPAMAPALALPKSPALLDPPLQ